MSDLEARANALLWSDPSAAGHAQAVDELIRDLLTEKRRLEAAVEMRDVLERVGRPGDEIVARGYFHMERMDKDFIWFCVGDHAFEIRSPSGAEIEWTAVGGWENLRAAPETADNVRTEP